MKTTSQKEVCKKDGLTYIETVRKPRKLKESEYYALMVTDNSESPHTKGVDIYTHQWLVGVERPNSNMGSYISKSFNKRKDYNRGNTIIVEVKNPKKYTIL